ncbi:hypothetical protein ERJ75_000237700 [Trypanosoma vivax]|nr:hypothetical protein TRVL_04052 [Trypanosoma vivax]KAH8618651.1 hypothetical protein ERJ75_000237700 [Trypanosoma vivax]
MEVYRRITERVRGALWAHHGRLMPERQFHRILAFVYNNKYEHQIRFDRMEVVGREWGGKVEVVTTPAGFLKRARINPCVEELSVHQQKQLILAAYADACRQGRKLMEEAEMNIYKQFLKDLKPIIMGIRDNPEFYTVPEDSIETVNGTLQTSGNGRGVAGTGNAGSSLTVYRTIPAARAHQPADEVRARRQWEHKWLNSARGRTWALTLHGKTYFAHHGPQYRPRGAPGAKKEALPLDIPAPYMAMDEKRLLKKNWMAYLDNKHVAEVMWTRVKIADREKRQRMLQETGQAWHRPINEEAVTRW